jgi:pimeloyl-ACP methyl ester carboxylesterase
VNPEVITAEEVTGYWMIALDAYARAQYTDPEEAIAEYLSGYTGDHHQELRDFVINNLVEDSAGRWSWRFDGHGLMEWMEQASANKEAHWSALQHIACPTLVITAANNPFTDLSDMERMVQVIPQAQLVEIPYTGHDVHIDQYDVLMTELRSFLTAE